MSDPVAPRGHIFGDVPTQLPLASTLNHIFGHLDDADAGFPVSIFRHSGPGAAVGRRWGRSRRRSTSPLPADAAARVAALGSTGHIAPRDRPDSRRLARAHRTRRSSCLHLHCLYHLLDLRDAALHLQAGLGFSTHRLGLGNCNCVTRTG